jgi:hypothetical protein
VNAHSIVNLIGLTAIAAIVTTVVARPNSVQVIRALGDAWSGSLSAALGAGVRF